MWLVSSKIKHGSGYLKTSSATSLVLNKIYRKWILMPLVIHVFSQD